MLHQRKPLKQQADKEHFYSEEAAALLPAPISSIQIQKKNKSRFSIFVEEEFLVGVSDAVLTKFNLYKGSQISHELLQQIAEAEDEWAAREYLIRLLSRRDHSRKELQTKALKKGIPSAITNRVLDELEQKNYIDDEKFAHKFASDKFEFNDWGPMKIRGKLLQKGITPSDIDSALKHLDVESTQSKIQNLVLKRKVHFMRQDIAKRRLKIFKYLAGKGFTPGQINASMPDINKFISLK